MSMETNEHDLDLIYMSDWSTEMHGYQDQNNGGANNQLQHKTPQVPQQSRTSRGGSNEALPAVSYANVFPGVQEDNDGDTVSSNTPMPFGVKKNVIPTIATIYEPKFFEIYQQYYQYILHNEPELIIQNPNQQHLMTLCLNYLLSFSNWARDAVNGNWIRASLFENPDMRPEVRNGLAMIIVYVFASARSADARSVDPTSNTDMFTVLMKAESGMGIVNKTSLKIYSDPFGYFNFIKTCISGLIDASAIPENERISTQATKKSRRGSRNKDEVEAYQYLKTQLMAMFQSPDSLQLAKDRINQILEFWHLRGKSIRNERFTSVFSLPPPIPGGSHSAGGANTHTAAGLSAHMNVSGGDNIANNTPPIYNSASTEYITIPGRNAANSGATRTSNRSSQGSGNNESSGMFNNGPTGNVPNSNNPPFYGLFNNNNSNNSNANTNNAGFVFGSNSNMFGAGNHLHYHQISPQQHMHYQQSNIYHQQQQQQQIPSYLQVNDNDSVVSDSGMSSNSRSPHPSFLDTSARSSGAMNFCYTNTTNASNSEDVHSNLTSARPTEMSILSFYQNFHGGYAPNFPFHGSNNNNSFSGNSAMHSVGNMNTQGMSPAMLQQQYQQQLQQATITSQQVSQLAGSLPIPSMRFDRQGMLSWSATTSLIYDMDALLQQNDGRTHFYLVDEHKLKKFIAQEIIAKNPSMSSIEEEELMKMSTFPVQLSYAQAAAGFGSMEKLLLKSNSVATSWQGAVDATQLRVFVEGWRNHLAMGTILTQQQQFQLQQQQQQANNNLTTATTSGGKRSASNSFMNYSSPTMDTLANNANSNLMLADDNASVGSKTSSTARLSRRRTSGSIDMKRDMTKLALQLQQQELQQQQTSSSMPAMFSPPKGMSPLGPSPSFTFGKTFNPNNNNSTTPNNNNNNNNAGNNSNNNSFSNLGHSTMTMLEYWQMLNNGNNNNTATTNNINSNINAMVGRGILVFERSNEVGLVVRANPQYGIMEDIWCLYYPDDTLQQFLSQTEHVHPGNNSLVHSFAAYLVTLLPQMRSVMQYIFAAQQQQSSDSSNNNNNNNNNAMAFQGPVTVSYFAHTHTNNANNTNNSSNNNNVSSAVNATGPPAAPSSMQLYRTLGSIDQNAHLLLSKLTTDAFFHEIIFL